jgi:hypothetical protein
MGYPRCFTAPATATLAFAGLAMISAGPAFADPPDDLTGNPPPGPPAVSMTTPEVVEGTGGPNEMVFTLELDRPASGGESLRFYTEDGQGSALPVEDHEPVLAFPVFEDGQTAVEVSVPLVADDVPEANEHILVTIDEPSGLTIADGSGTGIIVDDDIPTIGIDDVTLPEGSGGPTGFHFTIELSDADYATVEDATGLGTILDDDSDGSGDMDRNPRSTPATARDDVTSAPTTTTTARTAALEAALASTNQQAPIDPRLPAAIAIMALAAGSAFMLRRS